MTTATEIKIHAMPTIEETIDHEIKKARYEAVGWAHAYCCIALDNGEDPRKMDCSEMLKQAKQDLGKHDSFKD